SIVAMTANAMQGDRERCIEAGMDDHVAKPVRPENLRAALLRWSRPQTPVTSLPAVPAIDAAAPVLTVATADPLPIADDATPPESPTMDWSMLEMLSADVG